MIVVLDTSAAILFVLQRSGWENIRNLLEKADWIETPDLYVAEAANAIWKEHRFGSMGKEESEKALDRIVGIPDQFVSGKELYREAFALSALAGRPAYDMFFLVLARRHNAVLASMDRNLLSFAAKQDVKILSLG